MSNKAENLQQLIDSEIKDTALRMGGGGVMAMMSALTLNQWVAIFTIIYFLLQIGLLIPRYIEIFKEIFRKPVKADGTAKP